jgi:hypothetical protein
MKLQLVLAVMSLTIAGAAAAESVPHPGACKTDASKLCGTEVKTRDKAKIQACLVANAEKVSAPCRENLKAAQAAKAAK